MFKIISGDFEKTAIYMNNQIFESKNNTYLYNAESIRVLSEDEIKGLIYDAEYSSYTKDLEKTLKNTKTVCFEYKFTNGQYFKAISDLSTFHKIQKSGEKTVIEEELHKKPYSKDFYTFWGVLIAILFLFAGGIFTFLSIVGLSIFAYKKFKNNEKFINIKNNVFNFISTHKKQCATVCGAIVLGLFIFSCLGNMAVNSSNYNDAKGFIEKQAWEQAHNSLIAIKSNYKDKNELLKEVDYNYYLKLGDVAFNGKNYNDALNNYNKAKTGFKDDVIAEKIKNTNTAIENKKKEDAQIAEALKKERNQAIANLKSKMRTNYDKVENTTWYYDKTSPVYANSNAAYIYMGHKDNTNWIRLRLTYAGSDWIFFNKIIFIVDGQRYEKYFGDFGTTREVVMGGGVYETVDLPYEGNEVLIYDMAHSKNTTIRFTGQKYVDRTLTSTQKQAMQRILDLYDYNTGAK